MSSGDVIREARLRAGLSQERLAQRLGGSQQAVSRWESGRVRPSFETLQQVLDACGLQLAFQVVPGDRSYDALIEQQLARSPVERVRHLSERLAFKQRMRAAQESARAVRPG